MGSFDVVMPDSDEEKFIDMAISLGYVEIVFLSDNINYKRMSSKLINVKSAFLLHHPSEINKARKNFDYIFASAERSGFESKVDYIVGIEISDKKDSFHFRSTSLNQVHAELAKKNDVTVVFDFNSLFENPRMMLGRMFQNAVLVRKYKLKHSTFSMARKPSEMRSRNILDALGKVLGF